MPPQLATETAARAPNSGACAVVRARLGLSATASGRRGAFEDARVMRTWGLDRDWLERDPDSRIFSQAFMLLRRSGTNVAFAEVENLSALPIGAPPRKRSEISHGGCQMVARKNGLSEVSDKLLILR